LGQASDEVPHSRQEEKPVKMRGVTMPEIRFGVQFKNIKIFGFTVRLRNVYDSFKKPL
jgi:hypothetical protein